MEKISDNLYRKECLIQNWVYYIDDKTKVQIDASCDLNKEIDLLVLTHVHWDHVFAANKIKQRTGCKIAASENTKLHLEKMDAATCSSWLDKSAKPVKVDIVLKERDILDCGNYKLKILEVQGHTDSCIALYEEEKGILFTGDVWFRDDIIGRDDLPSANPALLKKSVARLKKLKTKLLCSGHNY